MAAVELAVRNDTFALGSDVDEDLVAIDTNHGAFDDIAVLEALDVGVLLGEELFHGGGLGSPDDRFDRRLGRLFGLLRGRRVDHVGFAHHDRFERLRGRRFAGFAHVDRVESGRGDRLAGVTRRDRFESGRGDRLAGVTRRDRFESGRGGRLAGLGRRGGDCLGGLVGDCYAGGLLGRLVFDGGRCLHLRRGPARLLFGQDDGLLWLVIARNSKTARAALKPSSRSAVRGLRALGPLLRSGDGSALNLSCPRAA